MKDLLLKYKLSLIGILIGVIYGVVARLVFGHNATLASITFLFVIPTILGIIPLLFSDDDKLLSYKKIIFIPWITLLTFFFTLVLLNLEDILCFFVLGLPFFILGTISSVIYKIFKINQSKNKNKLLSLVFLPFILSPVEELINKPSQFYTIHSEVIINSTPNKIWENIIEVKRIKANEYNLGVFNYLGIPRPISAEVTNKKIGGQRIGYFEGGLRFIEHLTEYQENEIVTFNIKVDKKSIGNRIFEQHVLSGNYFNFVDASYKLIRLNKNQTKLILTSNYQLTSNINFYGKFWGDIILSDFQERLLDVLAQRSEKN